MRARNGLRLAVVLALAFLAAPALDAQDPMPAEHHHHDTDATSAPDKDKHVEAGAVHSMAGHHHLGGPHMKMTTPRSRTPEDLARADALVKTLRGALERYKDYRVALTDGYQIFLPTLPQPQYHFTHYWNGFLEAFTFDPARPTSLLYKKTRNGYELLGAMYTMPKNATEDQLNARVPLSVASWHLHTNLCMPAKGQARVDWTKFGLAGSIFTPAACAQAGGRFMPSVFGWMVHVYPFKNSPEKVWAR